MVGPVSKEDRDASTRRLKVGFVCLVGLSAGLIALHGDPSPIQLGGAVGGGLVVGAVLVWLVFPDGPDDRR